MTKSSQRQPAQKRFYCVRFMQTACYKITLQARDEPHAVALAKRRWFRGSEAAFVPCGGKTDGWDAYAEPDYYRPVR